MKDSTDIGVDDATTTHAPAAVETGTALGAYGHLPGLFVALRPSNRSSQRTLTFASTRSLA